MEKYELQKLRDLPIEGVAERLGLRVSRHKSLCPFHDDHHASLSFSVSRNTFRCFACGAHGGTIDLAEKMLGSPFLEACRWLAGEIGAPLLLPRGGEKEPKASPRGGLEGAVPRPFDASRYARYFERPWLSPAARRFLFEERRLDPRVVRWCRLTSWRDRQGIDWLQIPYYNMEGKLIGLQNRNLTPLSSPEGDKKASPRGGLEGVPRFRFPQGSECSIYNLPILNQLSPGEALYITEGSSDCWAMLSAGHKAIAIPSATLLKPKDKELLRGLGSSPYGATGAFRAMTKCHCGPTKGSDYPVATEARRAGRGPSINFHMFPDRDAPGERLFLQLKELLPNLEHHQLPLGCKDYSEYYLKLKMDN